MTSGRAPITIGDIEPPAVSDPEPDSSALGRRQPGLDGLRGVAALAVLVYHERSSWVSGGYLAVSTFFTLSGFLITGILLRSAGTGRDLRLFWGRRARRLMPGAFLALAGIVVFGATVATRQQAVDLPGDVLSAATWTANWRFVISGQSYADLFTAPSPVQHFWSLAIEEQFYVLLPIGLFLLLRRTRSPRTIGLVLGCVTLASSAWTLALVRARCEPESSLLRNRHAYGRTALRLRPRGGDLENGPYVLGADTLVTRNPRCTRRGDNDVLLARAVQRGPHLVAGRAPALLVRVVRNHSRRPRRSRSAACRLVIETARCRRTAHIRLVPLPLPDIPVVDRSTDGARPLAAVRVFDSP